MSSIKCQVNDDLFYKSDNILLCFCLEKDKKVSRRENMGKSNLTNEIIQYLMRVKGYHVIELEGNNEVPSVWCAKATIDMSDNYIIFLREDSWKYIYVYKNTILSSVEQGKSVYVSVVLVSSRNDDNIADEIRSIVQSGYNKGLMMVNEISGKVTNINCENRNIFNDIFEASATVNETKNTNRLKRAVLTLKNSKVTSTIIAINLLMFIISAVLSRSILDINSYVLYDLGASFKPAVQQGQLHRLITAMFLHGGLVHIAFNMYALFILGTMIEKLYGSFNYFIIYFISGICSSILSVMLSATMSMSVGASGAIFGLLGAALVFGYRNKNSVGKEFMKGIIQVIAINIVIGLSIPQIDNLGHIGGLIGGIVISFIISLTLKKR